MRLHRMFGGLTLALLAACTSSSDKDHSGDWTSYGRDAAEARSSPLTQITPANVAQLKPAWFADLSHIATRAFEATPLVIDGVLYVSTGWSHALAYDARTGKELWHYDPKVDKAMGGKGCCGPASRGLAYADGRVFLAAFDGRLIALDAKTGQPAWSVQTLDPSGDHTVTGAPRAFGGLVLIGNGGAELGVRGYVSAYDQKTGKLVWRFYTVPPKPGTKDGAASDAVLAKVADGWSGEWWRLGGGGTVWDSIAYDPALDLVYIGVGNGGPWSRKLRSDGKGDNLFLSSIVALKAKTGEHVWHFQTTPGDEWDYTATQSIILADLEIDGKPRKVLMQAPKNGFFYMLDRATGQFLSGTPYVTVTWAKGLDPKTGRPIENPGIRWSENGQTSNQQPGALGGHNWHSMSYSAKTGLAYIPGIEAGFGYVPAGPDYKLQPSTPNMGIDPIATSLPDDLAIIEGAKKALHGELIAWDPIKRKAAWRVRLPVAWNGGTLVTDGGLVFQGTAKGDLVAYDAASGKALWSHPLGAGIVAAPMTYSVGGEQYVAVTVGWGGGMPQVVGGLTSDAAATGINRLVVLKLGGKTTLPAPPVRNAALAPPPATGSAATVDAGRQIYARRCYFCHGSAAVSGGEVPDLRYSASLSDAAPFRAIVREGALAMNGMPSFQKVLSDADVEAIRAYIVLRANQDKAGVGQ
ncbi:PQQ-dependent dehydrogenase (methanol/ethanol family) [Sphingobium xanthum]|uniref:PQQ-dependent dehydrogenase, methanol/ethanol family n=1 Tax=Sphingobium xanthum TaxID=1387165 RepID=UPI001FE936F0|nr:PQQ-dependent dehydrogenase, methanol/ethanol family [Sphingobium xanthum]